MCTPFGHLDSRNNVSTCGTRINSLRGTEEVTQVPNLAEGGDEIERDEDDAGADEADEEVELEIGLAAVGPRQRDVDQEPDHSLQKS